MQKKNEDSLSIRHFIHILTYHTSTDIHCNFDITNYNTDFDTSNYETDFDLSNYYTDIKNLVYVEKRKLGLLKHDTLYIDIPHK